MMEEMRLSSKSREVRDDAPEKDDGVIRVMLLTLRSLERHGILREETKNQFLRNRHRNNFRER